MAMLVRHSAASMSLFFFALLALVILGYGALSITDGGPNLALNLGVEILGTLITVAVIGPIVRSTQEGNVRSHPTLNIRRFVDRSAMARRQVQVLATFSNLLNNRETERFLGIARQHLDRGIAVEFLLLHPDSLSSEQRQRELRGTGTDVSVLIHHNVRVLNGLLDSVAPDKRRNLSVRLYDASASVILYRWDDRGLTSFLPTDGLAEEGEHLEVDMRSPLGGFVSARFAALWHSPTTITLQSFLRMPVVIIEDGRRAKPIEALYVTVEQGHYLVSSEILAALARRPGGTLRARRADDDAVTFDLFVVDDRETDLQNRLVESYHEKYDMSAHTFVGMRPSV
ncbi:hypothetical protein AB0M43_28800 [Longispora sp. NPDC051575]|uniref:hypothetical protein n=1 Tax=Longispora sp. NPDC051575 TaxID=3154943 RepID=UPI0034375B0F